MTRAIGFTALNLESGKQLAPRVDVTWQDRYLGAPTVRAAGAADDGAATDRGALCYRSGALGAELLQLKSNGTTIQFQARDATTLAVTLAWSTIATTGAAGCAVALMQVGSETLGLWLVSTTEVVWATSTDGGRTWTLPATLRLAGAGNTIVSLLQSQGNVVAVEERFAASTARLHTYTYSAGAWTLTNTHDTGGLAVWGGGVELAGGPLLVYAVDLAQTTTLGTVTLRVVRIYDASAAALRGTLHQGVAGGVRWRDPVCLALAEGRFGVFPVVQLPRGSGDLADRVSLYRYLPTAVDAFHPLGAPRAIYACEDHEGPAVCSGGGALFLMAGSYVQRLTEATGTGTLAVETLDVQQYPEDESLALAVRGSLSTNATQLRVRLGYAGDYTEWGVWWAGPRVGAGRQGAAAEAYGMWGVLERELQQMSCELNEAGGSPMTPGHILQLIFTGLGFTYSEDAALAGWLQPAVANRLRWNLRYGDAYADLVRSLLFWCGCEARAGVAADGVTPTVSIMRPGSRYGPTPAAAKALGDAALGHPALEVVSIDPERASDATLLPGGWDVQIGLDWYADRQLVLDAGGAYGVTSTIEPATRALARALAGADAGYVVCRPALEVELWDTISVDDAVAGLAAARRLVNSVEVTAGRGRSGTLWVMRLGLGLE